MGRVFRETPSCLDGGGLGGFAFQAGQGYYPMLSGGQPAGLPSPRYLDWRPDEAWGGMLVNIIYLIGRKITALSHSCVCLWDPEGRMSVVRYIYNAR